MSITIGKGITGQSGTLTIFGQSIPNYLSSVLSSIIGDTPWSISNPTSSFDLSNIGGLNDGNATTPAHYGIDNEVVVALYTGNIPEGSSVVARWYRSRDNRCVFTFYGGTAPSGGWGYFTVWIGWVSYATQRSLGLSGQDEIVENGDYYVKFTIGSTTYTSSTFSVTGIPPSNLACDSQTTNSISVHAWYGGSTPAYTCKIFCNDTQISNQSYYGGSTNWITNIATASNLYPPNYGFYEFIAVFYDQAGYEITQTQVKRYYTRLPVPTVTVTTGMDWIRVQVNSVTGADGYHIDINGNYAQNSQDYTYTGLTPDTSYTINVYAWSYTYPDSATHSQSYNTLANRPSNWTWTTAELNAFNNHGSLTTLTYSRWNAFLDRITEFEVYKYGSALTAFDKMTSSDKTLTAARFNQARFAIGSMYSTGITNKSSGDPVLGSYFITMANSLNSIT
jgi:hypothetical protein